MKWRGCFGDCVNSDTCGIWEIRYSLSLWLQNRKRGEPLSAFGDLWRFFPFSPLLHHIECACWNLWENDSEWTLAIIGPRSALVCKLANHANALSLLHSLPSFTHCGDTHTHTHTHKSPLCLPEHRGGSHLTLPEWGHIRRQFQTMSRRVDNSHIWSKWRRCMTLELNLSSCAVYNVMYIKGEWGEVELQRKMTERREMKRRVFKKQKYPKGGEKKQGRKSCKICSGAATGKQRERRT